MPQKTSPRTPRTWGTRFDPLPSSPPPSPTPDEAADLDAATVPETPTKGKEDKMPHDASVFVGSLPSNMEQPELTHLLSEHLSEHAEVKNIKVVRDQKGGVCAFVQCENASSAATLIQNLQTDTPKPFLGRVLRYEPARAFRTFIPTQLTPAGNADAEAVTPDKAGTRTELALPFSMRLWRPRNSKFYSLLYNTEAREAENRAKASQDYASQGLYLEPLSFDAQTIYKLAANFGQVEQFSAYNVLSGESTADKSEAWKSYPAPHDTARSSKMDSGCWEIKWNHRDDCISALMTLRRVPHLTVTWAHQPASSSVDQQPQNVQRLAHPGSPYPLHVQDVFNDSPSGSVGPTSPTLFNPHSRHASVGPPPGIHSLRVYPKTTDSLEALVTQKLASVDIADNDGWKLMDPIVQHPHSPRASNIFDGRGEQSKSSRVEWTEMDFPPLGGLRGEKKAEFGVWGDKKPQKWENEVDISPSPSSCLSLPATPLMENSQFTPLDDISESGETIYQDEEGQELDMPMTPDLGRSPITPKTPGATFPMTPTSGGDDYQPLSFKGFDSKERPNHYSHAKREERDIDPTTLFVGGLEYDGPGAWNEAKIADLFGRFGGVENVKFVHPPNARSAFAFVKFNNIESPARAVFEEHNRVHGSRQMRVQLRECNPSYRGGWKYRGRGRYQSHPFTPHRRYPGSIQDDQSNRAQDEEADIMDQYADAPENDDVARVPTFATLSGKGNTVQSNVSHHFSRTPSKRVEVQPANEVRAHDVTSGSPSRESSTEPPAVPGRSSSQFELYRDWYDEPASTTPTGPPSSFGSSASATAPAPSPAAPPIPYPMPNTGYYPYQPWMPPFPQQIPYQMPYFPGYPGGGMPQPGPPPFVSPAGSEASAPSSGTQIPWAQPGGMFSSYIPYAAYTARAPSTDQPQPQQPQQPGQAPLVPTGFIQNEQGTLIAVYHPEALDQYMSTTQSSATPSQPLQTIPSWPQYPHPSAFPFPGPPPHMMGMPPRQLHPGPNAGWNPGQCPPGLPPPGQQPPHMHGINPSLMHNGAPALSGLNPDTSGAHGTQGHPHLPRRHTQPRQNPPNAYNLHRNHHARSYPPRGSRGGGNPTGYTSHTNLSQPTPSAPTQFSMAAEDWTQWTANN